MEHNFDADDLATFNRSLQLLHSPRIDSQRKLFHLLQQSLRKHHPETFGLSKKTPPYQNIETSLNVGIYTENQRDPRLLKPNERENTTSSSSTEKIRDPRFLRTYERTKVTASSTTKKNRDPRLKILPYTPTIEPTASEKMSPSKVPPSPIFKIGKSSGSLKIQFPSLSMGSIAVGRPSVTLKGRNLSKLCQVRSSSKIAARHNSCPNPVNLKKIRAVLARGDPFPTYLVKGCSNNITPDLHREKL